MADGLDVVAVKVEPLSKNGDKIHARRAQMYDIYIRVSKDSQEEFQSSLGPKAECD